MLYSIGWYHDGGITGLQQSSLLEELFQNDYRQAAGFQRMTENLNSKRGNSKGERPLLPGLRVNLFTISLQNNL